MTWVKVCGLTRRDDVVAAVEAGADAVGFVTASSSERCVAPDMAAQLGRGIAALRILVTEDLPPEVLLAQLAASSADGAQPHGEHAAAAAAAAAGAGYLVLRPVAVAGPIDLAVDAIPVGQIPLLDTWSAERHGGTGSVFDWSLAEGLERRFILAGGLGPGNVATAIRRVRPWGVDASSRLETSPGAKDAGKVAAFITEAKRA